MFVMVYIFVCVFCSDLCFCVCDFWFRVMFEVLVRGVRFFGVIVDCRRVGRYSFNFRLVLMRSWVYLFVEVSRKESSCCDCVVIVVDDAFR